jgi:hypothetical protein
MPRDEAYFLIFMLLYISYPAFEVPRQPIDLGCSSTSGFEKATQSCGGAHYLPIILNNIACLLLAGNAAIMSRESFLNTKS